MNNSVYLPERFKKAIVLHVVKNLISRNYSDVPLILGIHGPSGEGKTFGCEHVVKGMGAQSFLISGGQLESDQAGEPAKLVRNTYLAAGAALEKGDCPASVVVINDFDTGAGNWGDMVQYTVNRQTIYGELMHIVDYPNSVEGRETRRIPIILTGNDFTKLYQPLVRAGRMVCFEWNPLLEEKARIVAQIFPDIGPSDCMKLVNQLNQFARKFISNKSYYLPIAFFSHLKMSLNDNYLWKEIKKLGLHETIKRINNSQEPVIHSPITFERLKNEGQELIKSGQLINHLTV